MRFEISWNDTNVFVKLQPVKLLFEDLWVKRKLTRDVPLTWKEELGIFLTYRKHYSN